MKKSSLFLIIISTFFFFNNFAYSQVKLGPGIGMNININSGADIKAAGGVGFLASGQLEIPLNNVLEILMNVQFYDNRSGFFKQSGTRDTLDSQGEVVPLKVNNEISTSLAYFAVEPILMVRTSKIFYFLAGLSYGYTVQKTYKVTTNESLPAYYNGPGTNLPRPQYTVKGTYNNIKNRYAMKLGFGFDIPGSIFEISPQLYFDYGFTKVTSDIQWKVLSFQTLVTFKFKLN